MTPGEGPLDWDDRDDRDGADPERDRRLDALLRQPMERLAPPDGAWERVSRRARRRKYTKAALAVAAVALVVAGAIPAVLGVRHDSNNERLAYSTLPTSTTSGSSPTPATATTTPSTPKPLPALPAVPPSVKQFQAQSLSFISQQEGYLWGAAKSSSEGVVLRTSDGGGHWQQLPAPPVEATTDSQSGDSQIRFASPTVGFVYGAKSYVSVDGGATWQPFVTPGYVEDLESVRQNVWALIRAPGSTSVRLYTTTTKAARFHLVSAVPAANASVDDTSGSPGTSSIALSGQRVGVLIGGSEYYSSPDGQHFTAGSPPCPQQVKGQALTTALVSSWGSSGVVAGCGYNATNRNETKLVYTTSDSGQRWQPTAAAPRSSGVMQTLSASAASDLIIGSAGGAAQASTDGGATWSPTSPDGLELRFAGYIDTAHIVAIGIGTGSSSFTASLDTGQTWTTTTFR